MKEKYIGKTCPYCKTPITDSDTVVFCSVCDMPHHLSCWQDNQGCTTFGCTGSIKEIIGNGSEAVAASAAEQKPAQAPESNPAPMQTEPPEKPIETLFESNEMVFMSDVPVVLENTAIIIDRIKDKLFARCTFRSTTDKAIKAVLVEITCQDVWGTTLGEPVAFQYLDLKTKRDSKFGQTNPVELIDKNTRKISVSVKKVMFEDDTVASGGGIAYTMPAPILLSEHLGSKELAEEYARETTSKAQFVARDGNDHWFCTCGAINAKSDEKCYSCGSEKEKLIAVLDPSALEANMIAFVAEKRAAEEKARAEQAERIRLAEEQVKAEQERKEREIKIAQSIELAKKRRKKIITGSIISAVSLVAIVCITIFFGIPFVKYQKACKALENGKYEAAYHDFKELGSYKDADEKLTECIYDWADEVLSQGKKSEANLFKLTVSLKSEHYSTIYYKIWNKINNNPEFDYWDDYWNDTEQASVVYTMLQMLPSSYEDTSTLNKLNKLFRVLSNGDIHPVADYIRNNSSFLKSVWAIGLIQDFVKSDEMIACFLEGYWESHTYNYYMNFYENDTGGTMSVINLPRVAMPAGAKYYDIEDMIYYWEGENGNHLAKVFQFEIVDYDTIKVYCYKNGSTYTLYRN